MEQRIFYHRLDMPIGSVLVAASDLGLCYLSLSERKSDNFIDWAGKKYSGANVEEKHNSLLASVETQLTEYFAGKREAFSIALDLKGTVFQRRVWHVLMQIPYGSTVSYKDVAIAAGNPAAVRAVGQANNRNPVAIIVPCHRVVGSDGRLIGYGGGLDVKSRLLELEGVKIIRERVV